MHRMLLLRAQFFVFLLGGLVSATVDIGLMTVLIHAGIDYRPAASAGFLAGLMVNYAFHARLTFKTRSTPANFVRYLFVVALNYGLTMLCVIGGVHLGFAPVAGKLVSLPLVAMNGFLLSKFWIFK